jgi:hypothetical protein
VNRDARCGFRATGFTMRPGPGAVGGVDYRIRDFNVIVAPSTTNVPYPRW